MLGSVRCIQTLLAVQKSRSRKRGLSDDRLRAHLLEGRLWPVSATLPRYCETMSNEPSADKLHKTSGRNRIGGGEISGRLSSKDFMRIMAAIRREEEKCWNSHQCTSSTAELRSIAYTKVGSPHGEVFAPIRSARYDVVPWRMARAPRVRLSRL
jgi:hypothetical protein